MKWRDLSLGILKTFFVFLMVACSNNQTDLPEKSDDHNEIQGENYNEYKNEESNNDISTSITLPTSYNDNANQNLLQVNTKNTTRLGSDDPIEVAVLTSQTIWPATHYENRPGTVILAPVEQWQLSLVSLNLVHHPNDGPLLYTQDGTIPDLTLNEIKRLLPKGNTSGIQVMIIGDLNEGEMEKLNEFKLDRFNISDVAAFANEVDKYYSEITTKTPLSVLVGSMEGTSKSYTIVAGSWISHMPEPLLYVSQNDIPSETIDALKRRNGRANIYVLGSSHVISDNVLTELKEYGIVTRIEGDSPTELSLQFAQFKDRTTMFGWGINKPGHGLMVVSTQTPDLAIVAAPFAHLGKHAPLIWLNNGELTNEWFQYLKLLKSTFDLEPMEGPYNHAYIIGTENFITHRTQGIIDEKLEITPAYRDRHEGH